MEKLSLASSKQDKDKGRAKKIYKAYKGRGRWHR